MVSLMYHRMTFWAVWNRKVCWCDESIKNLLMTVIIIIINDGVMNRNSPYPAHNLDPHSENSDSDSDPADLNVGTGPDPDPEPNIDPNLTLILTLTLTLTMQLTLTLTLTKTSTLTLL